MPVQNTNGPPPPAATGALAPVTCTCERLHTVSQQIESLQRQIVALERLLVAHVGGSGSKVDVACQTDPALTDRPLLIPSYFSGQGRI